MEFKLFSPKKIKIQIINIYLKLKYYLFLNTKSKRFTSCYLTLTAYTNSIDIVTIAFNNSLVIKYQIEFISKNVIDNFTHIIADNSTDASVKNEIFDLCLKNNIIYISIPEHKYIKNKSHAAAMHWIYKNVIKKRKSKYFGFIDHDIFPVFPLSIIKCMNDGIYGYVRPAYCSLNDNWIIRTKELPYWFLWAGLCFFKASLFEKKNIYKLNFAPLYLSDSLFLDTGGGLWTSIYRNMNYPGEMITYKAIKFRDVENGNIHTDYYEIYNEWIHFVNISNWFTTEDFNEKIDYMKNILDSYLV